MKMKNVRMIFNVSDEVKEATENILTNKLCLSYSDVVRLYFAAIVSCGELPLYEDINIPDVPWSSLRQRCRQGSSKISVLIPAVLKEKACDIIENKLGTTPSMAVELALEEIAKTRELPFDTVAMSDALCSSNDETSAGKSGSVFNIRIENMSVTINGVPADVISGTVA